MEFVELLDRMCRAPGLSGRESPAAEAIARLFRPHCDDVQVDSFNNVIARKRGTAPDARKIMLAAHLDEVGFMVSAITERGFLRLRNVGGIDTKILPAQELHIHAGSRTLPGIVLAPPGRGQGGSAEDRTGVLPMDDILVDTGFPPERVRQLVRVGDPVTYAAKQTRLGEWRIADKTFDNRANVAIMAACAERLALQPQRDDIYFVATSREETGAHGAIAATNRIGPDLAIVFDVGQADSPDATLAGLMNVGAGPYVTLGPQLHEPMARALIDMARRLGIPYQVAVGNGWTGTDASAIHVLAGGVPCVLVGISLRYMHTPVETIDLRDALHGVRLVEQFLRLVDRHEGDFYAFASAPAL